MLYGYFIQYMSQSQQKNPFFLWSINKKKGFFSQLTVDNTKKTPKTPHLKQQVIDLHNKFLSLSSKNSA